MLKDGLSQKEAGMYFELAELFYSKHSSKKGYGNSEMGNYNDPPNALDKTVESLALKYDMEYKPEWTHDFISEVVDSRYEGERYRVIESVKIYHFDEARVPKPWTHAKLLKDM